MLNLHKLIICDIKQIGVVTYLCIILIIEIYQSFLSIINFLKIISYSYINIYSIIY